MLHVPSMERLGLRRWWHIALAHGQHERYQHYPEDCPVDCSPRCVARTRYRQVGIDALSREVLDEQYEQEQWNQRTVPDKQDDAHQVEHELRQAEGSKEREKGFCGLGR